MSNPKPRVEVLRNPRILDVQHIRGFRDASTRGLDWFPAATLVTIITWDIRFLQAPALPMSTDRISEYLAQFSQARTQMIEQLRRVIVGQTEVIEQILAAIFTRGHCLLVGVPGLAKTLMVSSHQPDPRRRRSSASSSRPT